METTEQTTLAALCAAEIKFEAVDCGVMKNAFKDGHDKQLWRCRLTFKGREISTDYKTPTLETLAKLKVGKIRTVSDHDKIDWEARKIRMGGHHIPKCEDVLDSLISDASCFEDSRDLNDFAANYGDPKDVERTLEVWNACIKTSKDLRRFLGADLERFQQAERP